MPDWEPTEIKLEDDGVDPIQAFFAWLEGKKIKIEKEK